MSTFKDALPDKKTLIDTFSAVLSSDLPDFLDSTHSEQARVQSRRFYVLIAAAFFVATLVAFYIIGIDFTTWTDRLIVGIGMCWMVVLLLSGRAWFMSRRLLSREMNMAMTPLITNTIDTMALYTHSEETPDQVTGMLRELLEASDVLVHSRDRYQVFAKPVVQFDAVAIAREAGHVVTVVGGADLGGGVLVSAPIGDQYEGVLFALAATDPLLDTAWDTACQGKFVAPVSEDVPVRICLPQEIPQSELVETSLYTALQFLAENHVGDFIGTVHNGELQLLLLGDSIQIPVGSSTTDSKVVAKQGFSILQPIWKGLRVVEDLTSVV